MVTKFEPIEKFSDKVNLVLTLKESYNTLSYEEKKNPEIHDELIRRKILVSLNSFGYDVINDLFYVEEAYLWKYGDTRIDKTLFEIYSPKPAYKYCRAPRIYFDTFRELYAYLDGDIYGAGSCFYQYNFTKNEVVEFNIKLKDISAASKSNKRKLNGIISDVIRTREFKTKLEGKQKKYIVIRNSGDKLSRELTETTSWDQFVEIIKIFNNALWNENKLSITRILRDENFQEQIFDKIDESSLSENYLFIATLSSNLDYEIKTAFRELVIKHYGKEKLLQYVDYIEKNIDDLTNAQIKIVRKVEAIDPADFKSQSRYRKPQMENGMCLKAMDNYLDTYYGLRSVKRSIEQKDIENQTLHAINDEDLYEEVKTIIPDVIAKIYKYYEEEKNYSCYKKGKITNIKYCLKIEFLYEGEKVITKINEYNNFSEFVYVLNGDLSYGNFLGLKGLKNINDLSKISLLNADIDSDVADKLGIEATEEYFMQHVKLEESNPDNRMELEMKGERFDPAEKIDEYDDYKIYYISDLHLEHRFKNYGAKTEKEIDRVLDEITKNIGYTPQNKDYQNIVIINGDVCHDADLFEWFVDKLAYNSSVGTSHFIFTLGNHEYWDSDGKDIKTTIKKYKKILQKKRNCRADFHLLDNSILYLDFDDDINEIDRYTLESISDRKLKEEFEYARLIFFGGTGFAGFNEQFNANSGIYRSTLSREQEIEESKKFNFIYEKVCRCVDDNKIIVVTHNPKIDWSGNEDYHKNFIYLSGHTHINTYYISEDYSVYADNQIGYYGYKTEYPKTKLLYFDSTFDAFSSYKDGIYEIDEDEYYCFLHAKNIIAYGDLPEGRIKMLKREGYYCFIFEKEQRHNLSILNGFARKGLKSKNLQYYYDNMLNEIHQIDAPLFKYTDLQKDISKEVVRFGGDGKIHGCIIDIDYYDHIYLNPFDLSIIPYNAPSMRERDIYKSVPLLLEDCCPKMYQKYIATNKENKYELIAADETSKSKKKYQHDVGTYPYKASRMMSKLQRINKNILTEWIPPIEKEDDGSIKQIGIDECTNDELKQIVLEKTKQIIENK